MRNMPVPYLEHSSITFKGESLWGEDILATIIDRSDFIQSSLTILIFKSLPDFSVYDRRDIRCNRDIVMVDVAFREALNFEKVRTNTSCAASCAGTRSFYEFCQLEIGHSLGKKQSSSNRAVKLNKEKYTQFAERIKYDS